MKNLLTEECKLEFFHVEEKVHGRMVEKKSSLVGILHGVGILDNLNISWNLKIFLGYFTEVQ